AGQVGQHEGRADGKGLAGGLAADTAQADAQPGRAADIFEPVAGGEGLGEQLGRVPEEAVQGPAERGGGLEEAAGGFLAEGKADSRTTTGQQSRTCGHGPPPSLTVLRKGGSWPLSSLRLLDIRSLSHPAPQSGTVRKKGRPKTPEGK